MTNEQPPQQPSNEESPKKSAWFAKQRIEIQVAILLGIFGAFGAILAAIITIVPDLITLRASDENPSSVETPGTETVTVFPSSTPSLTSTPGPLTLTFNPVADASILADSPTANLGSAITLEADNDPVVSFLLRFHVQGVDLGTVTNAKLRLYSVDDSDFGGYFHPILDNSWCEGSVTYDTRPTYDSSTTVATLAGVSIDNWYEVDVTSLVRGDGTYGIRVKSVSSDGADYSSKEGTHPPELVVTFTTGGAPTPAATPTSTPTPTVPTVVSSVNCSTDDAEEYIENNAAGNQGDVDLDSSDLEMAYESGPQLIGMRFNGIVVPQGATITSAYIEFEVDESGSSATNLSIRGEASDNAATFTLENGNISTRPRTTAEAKWFEVPEWTIVDAKWQTPDLSNVIQEIVDREGWSSGNSIVIIIQGDGTRTAESFDGEANAAPKLVITYAE